ncbi:MAG TPA: hypothetical protein VG013_11440 [Gemmataceae bacterium]|nr:hypothetical protein [Gemmataceae bacterium]
MCDRKVNGVATASDRRWLAVLLLQVLAVGVLRLARWKAPTPPEPRIVHQAEDVQHSAGHVLHPLAYLC